MGQEAGETPPKLQSPGQNSLWANSTLHAISKGTEACRPWAPSLCRNGGASWVALGKPASSFQMERQWLRRYVPHSSSPLYLLQPEAPGRASRSPPLQDPSSTPFLQCLPTVASLRVGILSLSAPSVPCSSLRHLYLRNTLSLAFPALSESPALAGL